MSAWEFFKDTLSIHVVLVTCTVFAVLDGVDWWVALVAAGSLLASLWTGWFTVATFLDTHPAAEREGERT